MPGRRGDKPPSGSVLQQLPVLAGILLRQEADYWYYT